MIVQEVIKLISRWLWLIVLLVFLGVVAALFDSALSEPLYQSEAGVVVIQTDLKLQIEPRYTVVQDDLLAAGGRATDELALLASLARNETIAESVFQELPQPNALNVERPQQLLGFISSRVENGIIKILARGSDAEGARMLADLWAGQYERYVNNLYRGEISPVKLESQLAATRDRYEAADAALIAFVEAGAIERLNTNIGQKNAFLDEILSQQRATLTQQFGDMSGRILRMQGLLIDAAVLQAVQQDISASSSNVAGLLSLLFLQTGATGNLTGGGSSGDAFRFVLQPDTLEEFLGSSEQVQADVGHLMVVFAAELARYNQQLEELRRSLLTTADPSDDILVAQALADISELMAEKERLQSEQSELQAERDRLWDSYSLLSNKQEEVRIATDSEGGTLVRYAVQAAAARNLSRADWQEAMLNAILGAVLALGIALVVEVTDDRLRSGQDIRQTQPAPFLGGLPLIAAEDEQGDEAHPPSSLSFIDAVRFLRAEIAHLEPPPHSMLITSVLPEEGKTTLAMQLAFVLAAAGQRVVLVDANFRSPALRQRFDLPGDRGLSEVLLAGGQMEDSYLQESGTPGLRVLAAGNLIAPALDLLASPAMAEVVRSLRGDADRVIIDSPALSQAADGLALSACAEGTILVLSPGSTPSNALQQSIESIENGSGQVSGIVLNRIPATELAVLGASQSGTGRIRNWLSLLLPPPLARRLRGA